MRHDGRFGRIAVLSWIALVVLLVGACGGGAEPTPAPAAPTAPPAPTVAPAAPTPAPPTPVVVAPTPTAVVVAPAPTPTARPTAPTPTAAAVQPLRGGVLNVRFNRDPLTWDPHPRLTIDTLTRAQPLYSNLVRMGAYDETAIEPDVAESYQTSGDGKTWTFKIRQGVKWHDGKPLTAEDVAHSVRRLAFPTAASPSLLVAMFEDVDTIEAVDASTVRVTLKRIAPTFLSGLSSIFAAMVPKHIEDLNKNPVFAGAFKLEKIESGIGTTLARNPDYYFQGLPYLDRIVQHTIPDNAAALAAFRIGRLDWTNTFPAIVTADNIETLRRDGAQVIRSPGSGAEQVMLNTNVSAFANPDVRRALHLATDRPEVLQVRYQGLGNPYIVSMPPGKWALPAEELKSLPGWRAAKEQDLAEARALMERAGYSKGNPLKINIMVLAAYQDQSVIVANQWRSIYVDARIETVDTAKLYERRLAGVFDTQYFPVSYTVDDPAALHGRFFIPGAPDNWAKYDLPDINRLYQEQSEIIDFEKRRAKVWELERKALELHWWIPVVNNDTVHALSARVRNWPSVRAPMSNTFRMEQVWLQK